MSAHRFKATGSLFISVSILLSGASAQTVVLTNKNLKMEINNQLQTKILTTNPGSKPLMNNFSDGEYLETKYFTVKGFSLTKKDKTILDNAQGKGTAWRFFGMNTANAIEKILTVKIYDRFPDAAYISVDYINHGKKNLTVKKWVNNAYDILPSSDSTRFWSFQGSSHSDRRDWIRPVNPGFEEQNFMGMNASDYGGGIPVIDLWRKDQGIAIGLSEPEPKLISLPIDYDSYGPTAKISIEYVFAEPRIVAPGDTLHSFETFVSTHQKDCFATLQNYGAYMHTKGIVAPPSEPSAYDPVWCAWGYERNFTLDQIYKTIPKVKALGIKWVGLDDGYQKANGDWHTNIEHFPGGDAQMKAFVDSLHAMGLKAVIWWAPLAMDINSEVFKKNPEIALVQQNGSPQFITYWNAYYMAPTDTRVKEEIKKTVNLFLGEWGFDAIKLDGQHMNACAPDYADGHNISSPEQSFEKMPLIFQTLFETARSIKPTAVVEFCPCGDCINFYDMPYMNQFVASDPTSSWQVRLKGKVYKALMPGTPYFGDHVELTDTKEDFPSQLGVGAVPGTKFTWPATGVKSVDENLLTPEKEILFKKYLDIYQDKMLSKGVYRGDLYDIGYDYPEAHCIQKDKNNYYAFYNDKFKGTVELRGLEAGKTYSVFDYVNNRSLGTVSGNQPHLAVDFNNSLLLEVKPLL
jgi:alpha-galactosidase